MCSTKTPRSALRILITSEVMEVCPLLLPEKKAIKPELNLEWPCNVLSLFEADSILVSPVIALEGLELDPDLC